MEFECGETLYVFRGEAILPFKLTDRLIKKAKLKFFEDKGLQSVESFENEPKAVLSAKIGAGPVEQAGDHPDLRTHQQGKVRGQPPALVREGRGRLPWPLQCDVPLMGDASDKPPRASELLEEWFADENAKTLGSLNDCFGRGAFALAFVLLLAVPALPLPTGGARTCSR